MNVYGLPCSGVNIPGDPALQDRQECVLPAGAHLFDVGLIYELNGGSLHNRSCDSGHIGKCFHRRVIVFD